jgi:hypothetical protein
LKRFWLECGETTFALEPKPMLIGRSRSCDLVVNDTSVSRKHARLLVNATRVVIEDIGSANGVFVNGNRLEDGVPAGLADGDQIQVGSGTFVLRSETMQVRLPSSPTPATVPGFCAVPYLGPAVLEGDVESTEQRHALDMLGVVADKLLAFGRSEDAERMLEKTLNDVLARVRSGHASRLPAYVYPKAAAYAVRLAHATGRGKWVDFAIELFHSLGRPLPAPIVDELYDTVRKVSSIDLGGFRAYVEDMRNLRDVTAAERFVIQRLQGLTSLASAGSRT